MKIIALVLCSGCLVGEAFDVGQPNPTNPNDPNDPGGDPTDPDPTDPTATNGLFSAASPWNIRATGRADAKSELMIGSLAATFSQTGRGFDIAGTDDYPDYGVPLFRADAGTPRVRIADSTGYWQGFDAMPMPVEAMPATGTDHHLSIWDTDGHTLWELWDAVRAPDGTWSAGAGAKWDTTSTGYSTGHNTLSARAYGGAAIAGAILYDELAAGHIDHALGMAYPKSRGQAYAQGLGVDGITPNIASHSDNDAAPGRNGDENMPEGARFRLKASVDVAARCGANATCKIIGKTLQTYGAYVVDNAAVATFYAEVLTNHPGKSWSGLLSATDARAFLADDFEVLALPSTLTQF